MNNTILAVLGSCILFASCESRSNQSSSKEKNSSDTIDLTDKGVHSENHVPHNSANMMSIMEKSMHDMNLLKTAGNSDVDFAAMMKLHHMSALEACQLVLQQGTDPVIKSMAQKMLADQQKEINEFDNYLASNKLSGSDTVFFVRSLEAMKKMNMDMDHSGSMDKQFVVMMIPHHQGAVEMSQTYLKSGRDKKLMRMASNIITSQEKEISELNAWLAKQN